jgi:nitrile hydratase
MVDEFMTGDGPMVLDVRIWRTSSAFRTGACTLATMSGCVRLRRAAIGQAATGLGSAITVGYILPMAAHDHDEPEHLHEDPSHLSEMELRVRALETVLVEKGYVESAALDRIIELYETKIGPHIGARIIAKAWTDPSFKRALLQDATEAASTLTDVGRVGDHLVAVENTPEMHNMVVCTLCSCYPWDVLGLPPVWYKSFAYRSRAVREPRAVLADFGVTLPAGTEIRVWDSTAETRFLVVPMRPDGTNGWNESQLAMLITRDSMVGTGLPKQPGDVIL